MRKHPEVTKRVITLLSENLEIPPEEVAMLMQKPWGLMQLMKGKWPDYRLKRIQGEIEDRLEAALRLVLFAERAGGKKPGKVKEVIGRLISAAEKEGD